MIVIKGGLAMLKRKIEGILKKWKDEFECEIPISVNLSRVDVYDPRLPEFLMELTQKYDIDNKNMHLDHF